MLTTLHWRVGTFDFLLFTTMDTSRPTVPRSQPAVRGTVWYDDGNVIIEAESTQFRVHRGVLAANSDIFRDLFLVPQPVTGERMVEGCPIVQMQDRANDWTHVLSALYNGR